MSVLDSGLCRNELTINSFKIKKINQAYDFPHPEPRLEFANFYLGWPKIGKGKSGACPNNIYHE